MTDILSRSYTPTSPLNLPEITIIIESYLTKCDLAHCLQVSKTWYRHFLPLLWSSIIEVDLVPGDSLSWKASDQQFITIFSKHASLVRTLKLDNVGVSNDFSLPYISIPGLSHLISLSLNQPVKVSTNISYNDNQDDVSECNNSRPGDSNYWNDLIDLILRNQKLKTLRLTYIRPLPGAIYERFWNSISHSYSLKDLFLYGYIESEDTDWVLPIIIDSLKLECLGISHSTLFHPLCHPKAQQNSLPIFPSLKSLQLRGIADLGYRHSRFQNPVAVPSVDILSESRHNIFQSQFAQLQLIHLCPNLEELVLANYAYDKLLCSDVLKSLTSKSWPRLCSISLLGFPFNDAELAEILGSVFLYSSSSNGTDGGFNCSRVPPVCLALRKCAFGEQSMEALKRVNLFKRINSLKIVGVYHSAASHISKLMQNILEMSLLLESFTTDVLLVENIQNGQGWACLKLRELKVEFDLGSVEVKTQEQHATVKENDEEQTATALTTATTVNTGRNSLSAELINRQRALYTQLNKLHHLKVLDLRSDSGSNHVSYRLDLDLCHNLAMLSDLRSLKRLYFLKTQRLQTEDLTWMRNHWPQLDTVSGQLHIDKVECAKLRELCQSWKWHT